MVNIDTVYQQVLAIANKEQRGYITPQEFNLFANLAQREIFEQYFYDLANFELRDSVKTMNVDTTDLVNQKLDFFYRTLGPGQVNGFNTVGNAVELPDFVYRVKRVEFSSVKAEYFKPSEYSTIVNSGPLTRPSPMSPAYTLRTANGGVGFRILVNIGTPITSGFGIHVYRLPAEPQWGYFVVAGKALHDPNPNKTTHFELHESEQPELVYKILKLAGVSMKHQDILQAGQGFETLEKNNEKQ